MTLVPSKSLISAAISTWIALTALNAREPSITAADQIDKRRVEVARIIGEAFEGSAKVEPLDDAFITRVLAQQGGHSLVLDVLADGYGNRALISTKEMVRAGETLGKMYDTSPAIRGAIRREVDYTSMLNNPREHVALFALQMMTLRDEWRTDTYTFSRLTDVFESIVASKLNSPPFMIAAMNRDHIAAVRSMMLADERAEAAELSPEERQSLSNLMGSKLADVSGTRRHNDWTEDHRHSIQVLCSSPKWYLRLFACVHAMHMKRGEVDGVNFVKELLVNETDPTVLSYLAEIGSKANGQ